MHSVYFVPLKCLTFLLPCNLGISSKATFNVTSFLSLSLSGDQISGVLFRLQGAAASTQEVICALPPTSPILEALKEDTSLCSTAMSVLGIQNFQHLSN